VTALLKAIMRHLGACTRIRFRVTYADGSSFQNLPGEPLVHFRFKTAGAQWNTIFFGHIGILESYFDQTLDIDGDFGRAFAAGLESGVSHKPGPLVWLRNQWHEVRLGNRSIAQAKANARFHYALGADFYGYWLDNPLMMYTCAYWKQARAPSRKHSATRSTTCAARSGSSRARAWWTSAAASAASCSGPRSVIRFACSA